MLSIDPENTRVALIGASQFERDQSFAPLPGVEGNIRDLAKLLGDPSVVGIPPKNVVTMLNSTSVQEVGERLSQIAREAHDTLVVYYSGHGKIGGSPPQLYLAMCETTAQDLQYNALSIEWVRSAIFNSGAKKKILILDCCYAGRGLGIMSDEVDMIKARLDLQGAYALAAAPANQEAIAPPGEEHTAFTGELIRVLRDGIDNGKEELSLNDIFACIRAEFSRRPGFPEPQQRNVQDGEDLVVARNRRIRPRREPTVQIMEGIRVLRRRIEAARIPPAVPGKTLNIAAWNIREFGRKHRTEAAVHYISQILRQFNIIFISEVGDDLGDFERIKQLLGPYWDHVFTSPPADARDHQDRGVYVFDRRYVQHTGLTGPVHSSKKKNKNTGEYLPTINWRRSPYLVSFRDGSFDFVLLDTHIRWDRPGASKQQEIKEFVEWIDKLSRQKSAIDKDIMAFGDFDIPEEDDELFYAITRKGLTIPDALRGIRGSNLAQNKRYDQILHYKRYTGSFTDYGGVLDFYQDDWRSLFPAEDYPRMTKEFFTYEISDHLPVWVQIDTFVDDEALDQALFRARRSSRHAH